MSHTDWTGALGRVASGVYIVTVKHNQQETGMLGSWIQQCSFDPPLLSLGIKRDRYIFDWLKANPFVVNILSEDQQDMLGHFGRGFSPEDSAFEGVQIARSPQGTAILEEALAWLECECQQTVTAGDHELILAKVIGGAVLEEGRPMVHIRKSGLHY